MNHYQACGFFCSLLLVSLAGICIAEETPGSLVYLYGEESNLSNESDGMFSLTIQNITTLYNITLEENNYSMPVVSLTNITRPLPAAILFSDGNNESVSLVTISNFSYSEKENILKLQITPLAFYDEGLLSSFSEESVVLDSIQKDRFDRIRLYLEMQERKPENTFEDCCGEGYDFLQDPLGTGNYCCDRTEARWCNKIYTGPCS